MRLLLDTCTFLWLAGDPSRISEAARAAIDEPSNTLYLSDVSVWEMVLKNAAGKLPLPQKPRKWIPKQTAFFQIERVPIEPDALFRSGELPRLHAVPFDRLLCAQAIAEPFHVVTPDASIRLLGASCIW